MLKKVPNYNRFCSISNRFWREQFFIVFFPNIFKIFEMLKNVFLLASTIYMSDHQISSVWLYLEPLLRNVQIIFLNFFNFSIFKMFKNVLSRSLKIHVMPKFCLFHSFSYGFWFLNLFVLKWPPFGQFWPDFCQKRILVVPTRF